MLVSLMDDCNNQEDKVFMLLNRALMYLEQNDDISFYVKLSKDTRSLYGVGVVEGRYFRESFVNMAYGQIDKEGLRSIARNRNGGYVTGFLNLFEEDPFAGKNKYSVIARRKHFERRKSFEVAEFVKKMSVICHDYLCTSLVFVCRYKKSADGFYVFQSNPLVFCFKDLYITRSDLKKLKRYGGVGYDVRHGAFDYRGFDTTGIDLKPEFYFNKTDLCTESNENFAKVLDWISAAELPPILKLLLRLKIQVIRALGFAHEEAGDRRLYELLINEIRILKGEHDSGVKAWVGRIESWLLEKVQEEGKEEKTYEFRAVFSTVLEHKRRKFQIYTPENLYDLEMLHFRFKQKLNENEGECSVADILLEESTLMIFIDEFIKLQKEGRKDRGLVKRIVPNLMSRGVGKDMAASLRRLTELIIRDA